MNCRLSGELKSLPLPNVVFNSKLVATLACHPLAILIIRYYCQLLHLLQQLPLMLVDLFRSSRRSPLSKSLNSILTLTLRWSAITFDLGRLDVALPSVDRKPQTSHHCSSCSGNVSVADEAYPQGGTVHHRRSRPLLC